MEKYRKRFIKNIIFAFMAQGISLIMSMIMSLIVPKVMGIEEFSYWQLFLFYVGYSNFFHLGINDGTYLRIGGKSYDEIDHKILGSEIKLSIIMQSFIMMIIIIICSFYITDANRMFIIITSAIYVVIYNASCYIGFIFQAVNQTKIYSISIIIDKVIFLALIIIILLFKVDNYKPFIIFYLCSWIISFLYLCFKGRKLIFSKMSNLKIVIMEIWIDITIGIKLMLASIASSLILGIGRMVVDSNWGIAEFGKFSFAISLTNFFLLFIRQISMVIFPELRRIKGEKLEKIYSASRMCLGIILPVILLAYIPLKTVLGIWLPQYEESLKYMALLLPLCTFDGKMQMICNTYFKVLRKENVLLKVNIISMIISLILSLIAANIFNNIYLVIIFMVISIALRNIISELYLSRLMNTKVISSIIQEVILVVVFVATSWYLQPMVAFITFVVAYVVFLIFNRKNIKSIISTVMIRLS